MVALQQDPPVLLKRLSVRLEGSPRMELMPAQMVHERRLFLDPPGSGMLRDQSEMRFGALQNVGQAFFQIAADLPGVDLGDGTGKVDARAPGVERRHLRQMRYVPAIITSSPAGQTPAVALWHLRDAPGYGQARRKALEIPFERGRQGLVKIIDIKDRRPFGRGIGAEIGQVTVAA